jgi:uncharacterized protein YPO0396
MTKRKALTKILIVNWGVFEETTLFVANDMILVGDSGTGKSTILDAVHFALSGNKKFNISANKKSTRSVEEYVLGFTGANEKESTYLRSGSVVSHIALEFSYRKDVFTIGAIIEYSGAGGCQIKFYHIPNSGINPNYYFEFFNDKKKVRNYKEMDAFVKSEGVKVNFDNSVKRLIQDSFQVTDKYFTTLHSAIGFEQIININVFFRNILLEEDPINILSLLSTVKHYKRLNETIRTTQDRINRLEEIEKNAIAYDKAEALGFQIDVAKLFLDENDLMKKISDFEKKVAQNSLAIESKEKEFKNFNNRIESTTSEKEKTYASLQNNNVYVEIDSLKASIRANKSTLESAQTKKKLFEKNIENFFYNNKHVQRNSVDFPWDEKNMILDEHSIINLLNIHYEKLSQSRDGIFTKKVNLELTKKNLYDERTQLNEKKELLSSRRFPYPEGFNELVNHLSFELEKYFSIPMTLKPTCSFLEIDEADSAWINALESVLGDKRFSLIIDAKYYDKAKEIYDSFVLKNPSSKGFEIVSGVYHEQPKVNPKSLFFKLQISNKYVRNYIEACLANITCVTVDELEDTDFSITEGCAVKIKNRYKICKDLDADDYYIGESARISQLKNINNLLHNTNTKLDKCKTELPEVEDEYKSILSASELIQSCKETVSDYKLFFELEAKINDLEIRYDSLVKDPTVITMMEALRALELAINELAEKRDILNSEVINLKRDISDAQISVENFSQELGVVKEELIKAQKKNENIFFDTDELIKQELKNSSSTQIRRTFLSRKESNQGKIREALIKTETLMSKYNSDENIGFGGNVDNSAQWINLLNEMRNITIMRFKREAEEKKEEAIVFFKANFLNVMYSKISDCHSRIAGLNKILNDIEFNGNTYRLTHKKTTDEPFSRVYDLIMASNKKTIGMTNLLSEQFSEDEEAVLDVLFNGLINDKGDTSKEQIDHYTDYRNYMNFDIVITKGDTTTNISTIIGKDSGGEAQTSFYIVIGASLKQCYRASRSPESFPLILLLDEAFGKMDSARIVSIIKYFNDLNTQIIMGVPNEKASTICPIVDTSYYVKKVGRKSSCQLFSKSKASTHDE